MIHRLRQFRWAIVTLIGCIYCLLAPVWMRKFK